jgi:GT2 family glycosyltransferase
VKPVSGPGWWLRRLTHPLETARVLGPRLVPPRLRLRLLALAGRWRPAADRQQLAEVIDEWRLAMDDGRARPARPALLWLEPGEATAHWQEAAAAAGWRVIRVGPGKGDAVAARSHAVATLRRDERLREAVVVWDEAASQPLAEQVAREHGWRSISARALEDAGDVAAALAELAPLVSILMVSHNNPAVTRLCLDSVATWTEYPRYEVVVVDNGSGADTVRLLAEAASQWPQLTLVTNPDNRGFAAACNQAAAAARGDVLCFLNNDTVVTPGWLSVLVSALEQDPELGLVGPVSNAVANEARVAADYASLGDMLDWAEKQVWTHDGRWFRIPMLALFCTAMRRQVWQQVGGLDEAFGLGMFEDDDYSRRLRQAGYHLACRRDSFVHHWQQASFQLLDPDRYLELYDTNRAYFKKKWGRG